MLRARNLDISEIAETAQIAQIAQPPASTALGTTKEHTRTQQGAHALGGGRRLLAGLLAQIEPRGEHLTPPRKREKADQNRMCGRMRNLRLSIETATSLGCEPATSLDVSRRGQA